MSVKFEACRIEHEKIFPEGREVRKKVVSDTLESSNMNVARWQLHVSEGANDKSMNECDPVPLSCPPLYCSYSPAGGSVSPAESTLSR